MAIQKKPIKGQGLVQLRSSISSTDGTTVTETTTFTGPYAELKLKQASLIFTAKGTALTPTSAGEGQLTVTQETELTAEYAAVPGTVTTEVIWQELRKPVETNPFFADLTPAQIADAKLKVEADPPWSPTNELAAKLYEKLVRGTTEWVTAVPVVRRTTTRVRGDLAGGGAWFREDPPIAVDGSWEWMKTTDDRRREGKSFTRTEEWTAAESWDEDLYPSPATS
jgi:hypothetical protein